MSTGEFQQKLRAAMAVEGVSVYALARRIDMSNPDLVERNIRRWLAKKNPTRPSDASRHDLAVALGLPLDFFLTSPWEAQFNRLSDQFARVLRREFAV